MPDILLLFVGGAVLVGGSALLLKDWRWRKALRAKYPGAPGGPYCCEPDCVKDAEFGIYGSSGHFEDVTEACEDHVGILLGTPTWLDKMNDHWVVHSIS
jgi:hypothetical protein